MQSAIKRAADIVAAVLLLAILSPFLVGFAVAIVLDSRGPVFFRQERVGRNGRPFRIWKYRTMIPNAVNHGMGIFTNANDPRVTRVGRFLRKHSLDELPQLLNILVGEMSIIGPRPTLAYQVAKYDETQRRRLLVPPGVTGWAQVHGRNEIPWPERIRYDVWYVDHWNLWLDMRILLKSFGSVLRSEGVDNDGVPDEISAINGGTEAK
jgi:undecaprenyl phosphate N,N'-diacetylbacillosamine 1-phosphate transferase